MKRPNGMRFREAVSPHLEGWPCRAARPGACRKGGFSCLTSKGGLLRGRGSPLLWDEGPDALPHVRAETGQACLGANVLGLHCLPEKAGLLLTLYSLAHKQPRRNAALSTLS